MTESEREKVMEGDMRHKNLFCILGMVFLISCNPEFDKVNRINGTLSAVQSPTNQLTYTNYPTYTNLPTYTIERAATFTPTASKTPDYTASAMPTITKRPTQPSDGTEAMTATAIQNHIEGQLLSDANCGISYEYPLEWITEYASSGYPEKYLCFYGNKPSNYLQIIEETPFCMGDYAIYAGVMNVPLEEAAGWMMVEYENGHWVAHGMQGFETEAQLITTRGLIILRATIYKEVWDNKCEARWGIMDYDIAIINNGKDKSIVMWDDTTKYNLHFEYLLQTINIY